MAATGPKSKIRVYRLSKMTHTIFAGKKTPHHFRRLGIRFTRLPSRAHVLVTTEPDVKPRRWLLYLRRFTGRPKAILHWCEEPRWDGEEKSLLPGQGLFPDVHVMNVYTGGLYTENLGHFAWAITQSPDFLDPHTLTLDNRRIVILNRFTESKPWIIAGQDRDLSGLRCRIALAGHARGLVDIYGKNWPEGVSLEDSRKGYKGMGWFERKKEILHRYRFNLAFENTAWPYYCTEKIWDAITNGCLPIYHSGGTRIYETFPRDSFIDYAEINDPNRLFQIVAEMSVGEFCERYNKCAAVMRDIMETGKHLAARDEMIRFTAQRIREIAGV